jgi:hypothetical protein
MNTNVGSVLQIRTRDHRTREKTVGDGTPMIQQKPIRTHQQVQWGGKIEKSHKS